MSSSHVQTEIALDKLLQNFQNGAGDSKSAAAIAAISEESMDVAWPQLMEALEDCGLDKATATENHLFIVDWLVGAMMDGLLPVDGIIETDSSSNYSTSDSDPPTPVEYANSSDSEPDEYPVILEDDHFLSTKPSLTHPALQEPEYLEPFGSLGRYIAREVRASAFDTYREDLNRARQYWKRSDWENVKKHLLRVLVAAHKPHHRQSDLSPRCATYLLGIAYSNSGDLERAKRIMVSVMKPFDINNVETAPCDDAQIAAATWLGDLCLKTNKTESAALAWSVAYDAAHLRSTYLSQGYPIASSDSTSEWDSASSSSSDSIPPQLNANARRPTSLSRTFRAARAQSMAILNRLESVNRKIRHLDALIDSLNLGWDPDNGDSIFSQHRLLTMVQMQRVAHKSRAAIDTAIELVQVNSRLPRPSVESEDPKDDSKPLPLPPRRQAIVQVPRERQSVDDILSLLTTAEDCLQSPMRSNEWPLAYDIRFSRTAVVKTLNWVYSFAPLDFEGVMSNIPSIDVRQYREMRPRSGRPLYVSERLDPKRPEDGPRFLSTLKRMLDHLHIEYLDEPGNLRCRSRQEGPNRWPSIAYFNLRVIRYKTDGFMKGVKFAVYIKDVMHWNGQKEEMIQDHAHTKILTQYMASTLQSYEFEDRKLAPLPPTLTMPSKSIKTASYLTLPKITTAWPAPMRKPIQISNPQVLVNSTAF